MASLSRAYGVRGAAIALGMACVAGIVHGTMAGSFDALWLKIMTGLAGAVLLIMGGAISARQGLASTISIGLAMAFCFVLARWSAWSLIVAGAPGLLEFWLTPPWGWPDYLAAGGITGFWVFEAVSVCVPALCGAFAGREQRPLPVS